jgi:predicted ATPase/class 3 adenylate cyclase
MDVSAWLRGLGLERYTPAFRDNDIDAEILAELTADDLIGLGVTSIGHRRRLLAAIAALREVALAPAAPLPTEAPGIPAAERRQLTVMFCDLVGSTALSARLDPEELREVIGAYHRCVAAVIEKSGGFVAKYMGDGVLAYFGYPRADEHDAERAVRAGLALVEAVAGTDTVVGAPLSARVGVATGLVVVGDLLGQGAAQEQAVVGETPNLAARLQALAAPGTVVIGPSTKRLTGGLFDYEDLGAVEIKGLARPVMAFRVLRESGTESRFEARHGPDLTPLVGRDEELALLQRRWHQAKARQGCVVLVSGEPGIGKSRLAQTLIEELSGETHTRLRSFCSPHHRDSALYPTITQLERAAGFRREDTADQRLDKLEAVLVQATGDLDETAPALAALLSLPTGERYPPLDLTPQKRKERTLQALLTQVEGLAARQPVLMLFEDAHWSDPTSLELYDLIVDRVPALRVLLIITFRPEFNAPWIGRPHVTSLTLNRLAPAERAEMIPCVTGGKALPEEIAEQIVDRTDGVPLFVEELTKAVVESGILIDNGDHYTAAGPMAPLAIPATLQASLLARLDRLAPVREVAQIGAALGRQFSHELIAAIAPMPPPQLDNALAQLVGAELIYRRRTPPDAEYTFKHALVQDAAYSTLLRSGRRQLHARIASTLEGHFPEIVPAQPALLAHHCTEAGLADKAIVYWLKAGQQTLARSAMTEAVALLRKGLDLLPGLLDEPWRWQQELELLITLGSALAATKGLAADEVGATLGRARTLAERLDRRERLGPLLVNQQVFHFVRAEHRLARSLADQMEKIGEERNDVAAQLRGRDLRGLTSCFLGQFVASRELLERCHGLSDPAYRAAAGAGQPSPDPYAVMLAHLANTLAYLGFIDLAEARLNEAIAEARRLKHAHTLAHVLAWATLVSWAIRSPELQGQTDELLELSVEHGFSMWSARATVARGRILITLGRVQEGLAVLKQGLAALDETGAVMAKPALLISFAQAHGVLGQPEEGLHRLDEAAQIIAATEERLDQAEVHRVRGDLLNVIGDAAAAEASYHEAITLAQQQSAKLWELRAATSLARLWRDQAKHSEARDLLAPVYSWFAEGFGTKDLKEARALLEELA